MSRSPVLMFPEVVFLPVSSSFVRFTPVSKSPFFKLTDFPCLDVDPFNSKSPVLIFPEVVLCPVFLFLSDSMPVFKSLAWILIDFLFLEEEPEIPKSLNFADADVVFSPVPLSFCLSRPISESPIFAWNDLDPFDVDAPIAIPLLSTDADAPFLPTDVPTSQFFVLRSRLTFFFEKPTPKLLSPCCIDPEIPDLPPDNAIPLSPFCTWTPTCFFEAQNPILVSLLWIPAPTPSLATFKFNPYADWCCAVICACLEKSVLTFFLMSSATFPVDDAIVAWCSIAIYLSLACNPNSPPCFDIPIENPDDDWAR